MSVCPTNFDEKVECPFVDRKEFLEAFENAFWNIDQKNYSILVYYGVAGIGKTSLRKKLPTLIEKHNESDWHTRVIWTSIDFATEQYRQPYKFLEILSSQLHQKYGIKFNSFDIALATYWKKINPHSPLVKENYSEDSIVRDVLDICDEFVPVNLIPNVYNLAKSLPERYQKWTLKRKEDISKLPDLEPTEIYERLPIYLAHDLDDHLQNTSESAVIFIDTYEALWEKERDKGSFNSKDEWLRKLIENIQKSCLWVICGKESLRWEEVDEDWKNYLDQRKIGKLPEKDALDLLKQCGVTEEDIQKILIESSEGVPYYLELSIDTYRKIKKKKQPAQEDFAKVPEGIFCRFVKYLDREEKETLKVLSVPRYWNRELFKILIEKFNTGYPATSFSELHSFSFMDVDEEGKCSMHQLMRKSLQEYQDPDLKKEVHNFMLDFYSNQLKDLDIKSINQEHENALTEAFYHAKEALEAEELYKWFVEYSNPFYEAASWQLILPIYKEILDIIKKSLGPENTIVAAILSNLATLYQLMGKYNESIKYYERSLKVFKELNEFGSPNSIATLNNLSLLYEMKGESKKALKLHRQVFISRKKTFGMEHPEVAEALNNLALFYRNKGKYKVALRLCEKSYLILQRTLGPENPELAYVINDIATLYQETGEYGKALHFFEHSLEKYETKLGARHPYSLKTRCNLAGLYFKEGKYESALSTYEDILQIQKEVLSHEHPDIAITLNNLGELLKEMGNFEEAKPFYQEALKIYENSYGSENSCVTTILYNLADVCKYMGEYKEALAFHQRALKILENNEELDNSVTLLILNSMADIYSEEMEDEKAVEYYMKSLKFCESGLYPKHPNLARTLNNIAGIYKKMGKFEESLEFYEKDLKISQESLGPKHPEVAITLNNLASLYECFGEFEKSLATYQKALEIFEDSLGPEHPEVAITLNNLAIFYSNMGKYEEAFPLLERALDIVEKKLGSNHPYFLQFMNNLISASEEMIDEWIQNYSLPWYNSL